MQGPAGEKFAVNVEGTDSVAALRYVHRSDLRAYTAPLSKAASALSFDVAGGECGSTRVFQRATL